MKDILYRIEKKLRSLDKVPYFMHSGFQYKLLRLICGVLRNIVN
jgi:hypothetical protein